MIEPGARRVSAARVISVSPKRTVSGSSMSRIRSRFAGVLAAAKAAAVLGVAASAEPASAAVAATLAQPATLVSN